MLLSQSFWCRQDARGCRCLSPVLYRAQRLIRALDASVPLGEARGRDLPAFAALEGVTPVRVHHPYQPERELVYRFRGFDDSQSRRRGGVGDARFLELRQYDHARAEVAELRACLVPRYDAQRRCDERDCVAHLLTARGSAGGHPELRENERP